RVRTAFPPEAFRCQIRQRRIPAEKLAPPLMLVCGVDECNPIRLEAVVDCRIVGERSNPSNSPDFVGQLGGLPAAEKVIETKVVVGDTDWRGQHPERPFHFKEFGVREGSVHHGGPDGRGSTTVSPEIQAKSATLWVSSVLP